MRKNEIQNVRRIVETKVVCDKCGAECTNTNFKILSKASFSDKPEHIEDLCWLCWDKEYRDKQNDPKLQ